MDQPHNQFLYKELVYSNVKYLTGEVYKINLYSTGNIDIFKKDIVGGDYYYYARNCIDCLIKMFYSTPKVLTFNVNVNRDQMPIMHNINDYLDKITFVPTEHVASFHFSKIPINYDIVHFIENILERNKGEVIKKDFEIIHYSIQKEIDNMELYNRIIHLNKIIVLLLYLLGLILLIFILYFIICKMYKLYEKLYIEYYDI